MLIIVDLIFDLIRLHFGLIFVLCSSTSLIVSKIKEISTKYESIIHILTIIGLFVATISVGIHGADVYSITGLIIGIITALYSVIKLTIDS